MDFVDVGGWLPMGLGAVIRAGLAAGSPRLGLGRPFGEGSGMALAGAGRLIELAAEALVLGLQVTEASLKGLAAGTRDGLHTSITGEPQAASALSRPRSRDQLELNALTKYDISSRPGCLCQHAWLSERLGV